MDFEREGFLGVEADELTQYDLVFSRMLAYSQDFTLSENS
jgi:hypothetical protein